MLRPPEGKHSPLPWKGTDQRKGRFETIEDAEGRDVVQTDSGVYINTDGDLEFIVHCVNLHAKLVSDNERLNGLTVKLVAVLENALPLIEYEHAGLAKRVLELLQEARGERR